MTSEQTARRIFQLRRILLLHSYGYYRLDRALVSDAQYDAWSRELATLQAQHPGLASEGEYADLFCDWTGETGYHLPAVPWAAWMWDRMWRVHQCWNGRG